MALHRLLFDPAASDLSKNANVGAFVRSDDGTLITHHTVGSDEGLDVYLLNTSLTTDSQKDEDSAHVSGDTGSYVLAVRADTRPTNSNTSADGDYASFFINDSGELYVKDTDAETAINSVATAITNITQDEDAAHASGDKGVMSLTVRNDTLASLVSADGDYAPLQVNSTGALYVDASQFSVDVNLQDGAGTDLTSTLTGGKQALDVNIAGSDIEIDVEDDLANTALTAAAESVTTTTGALITTPLSDRRFVWLYHNGDDCIFIGPSGVSESTGFPMFPGSIIDAARIGASVAIHAVAETGASAQDIRVLQAS